MADEEDDVRVEGYDENDSSTGEGGPLNPCASVILGFGLLVVSACGLWINEGTYVKTIQNLDMVSTNLVLPCAPGCQNCNFHSVEEFKTSDQRMLRDGDIVYMGCDISNLEDVNEALKDNFALPELTSILLGADELQKAGAFKWNVQTLQEVAEEKRESIPDLDKYQGGKYKNNPHAYCKSLESKCDPAATKTQWQESGWKTPDTPAAPSEKPEKPNVPANPSAENKCKGLNHKDCDEQNNECTWIWRCPHISEKEECQKFEPMECKWHDDPPQDCKGKRCCPTPDAWKFSCNPKPKFLHEQAVKARHGNWTSFSTAQHGNWSNFSMAVKARHGNSTNFSTSRHGHWSNFSMAVKARHGNWTNSSTARHGNWTNFSMAVKARHGNWTNFSMARHGNWTNFSMAVRARHGNWTNFSTARHGNWTNFSMAADSWSSHLRGGQGNLTSERRLQGSCVFEHCVFSRQWRSTPASSFTSWKVLPKSSSRTLTYVNPPAYNLDRSFSGQYISDKLRLGSGSQKGEGFGLGALKAQVLGGLMITPVTLKPHTPTEKMKSNMKTNTYTLKSDNGVQVKVHMLDRSVASASWFANNSWANVQGNCQENCICNSDERLQEPDLRACFFRHPAKQVALIAQAKAQMDGSWTLVENKDFGVLMKVNQVVPPEELIQKGKDDANTMLKVLRLILPLVMWLGFYCCLSPITWVVNEFQEQLENIPLLGDCLGAIVGFVETLMDCAICAVSCCGALSCSLLIGSIAWVWFRPMVGIPMLIAALALFAGQAIFAMSRQGAPKVRGRGAREVRQGLGVSMELPSFSAEAVVAQPVRPQPVQFVVVCPEGVGPGGQIQVQAPDGRLLQVQVPQDVVPGTQFMVAA